MKDEIWIRDRYEGNDKYVWWACWKKQREKFDKDFYNGFKSALSRCV